MTAVDHAARIAEELADLRCRDMHTGYTAACASCRSWGRFAAEHLRRSGVFPEAEVTEEWGVRQHDGTVWTEHRPHSAAAPQPYTEDEARRWCKNLPGYALVHRYHFRAEHVTEWETVD